jgi:hypothetical protein
VFQQRAKAISDISSDVRSNIRLPSYTVLSDRLKHVSLEKKTLDQNTDLKSNLLLDICHFI